MTQPLTDEDLAGIANERFVTLDLEEEAAKREESERPYVDGDSGRADDAD
jgi:hypothetical protein